MDELKFLGYLVPAIVTLGGFIAVIMKFTQPINDLRVVIQKLNDMIDSLKNDSAAQTRRIEKHGDEIDKHNEEINKLDTRVSKLETRVDMYHKEG